MGFERVNTNTVSPPPSKEAIRKHELADIVANSKDIKLCDRADIIKFMTGYDYKFKRGAPNQTQRNIEVTYDFLYHMGLSDSVDKDTVMAKLVDNYNLPVGDESANRPKSAMSDVNFNKIIVKNLSVVENYMRKYVETVDDGVIKPNETYNNCIICLKGLERYLRR